MILPVFLAMLFATVEFSWYMYQRSALIDVARKACQSAASLDPDDGDFVTETATRIEDNLAGAAGAGIDCTDSVYICSVTISDLSDQYPPRVECDVSVNYVSLSGFIPTAAESGPMGASEMNFTGILPSTITGTAVAIFEEAD